MAHELLQVSLLLLFFNSMAANYWNREFVTGEGVIQVFATILPYSMEI